MTGKASMGVSNGEEDTVLEALPLEPAEDNGRFQLDLERPFHTMLVPIGVALSVAGFHNPNEPTSRRQQP